MEEKTKDRIKQDLQTLTTMLESMAAYLSSMIVYYPLANTSYPRLTLGNYLMRQQRLLALAAHLQPEEKGQLDTAVSQFQQTIQERVVQVEQKGHEEAHIRLRQWEQGVNGLIKTPDDSIPYYATVVENRVMLAALLQHLSHKPYRLDEKLPQETAAADQRLQAIWQKGDFVWPHVWQPAYPEADYWWLYGQPTSSARS